jgi:hypothetical protein
MSPQITNVTNTLHPEFEGPFRHVARPSVALKEAYRVTEGFAVSRLVA